VPCESRDFDNIKASFNKGFTLSLWSRDRYKIDCVIMKCSIGNLPSSALTPIFEDIFLAPKVNLQKIKSILSQGVLSIKVKLSISIH
jgi:hypothetical protein